MPTIFLNLQLFGEEGSADAGEIAGSTAEVSAGEGVATQTEEQPVAQADDWETLIKGKYKEQYGKAVNDAVNKRFKHQKDLQGQIDAIDPVIRAVAQRYGIQADANGNIPIAALSDKVLNDNDLYEKEAFERGMSVEDLKQMKSLERENAQLRRATMQTQEQRQWEDLVAQGEELKQLYPSFDMDNEMLNPEFGKNLAFFKSSGIYPDPVRRAYELVHRDEIMSGAMQYAVQQTQQKISNSIQSGMTRPQENGTSQQAAGAPTALDPSKLSLKEIHEINQRAARGEKITF
ncbi:MAG: hypothetical protein IKN47_06960 [Lachnospiraceae bacterium]|nr:hypothetical protein [Lachnospiraceae bacterium]